MSLPNTDLNYEQIDNIYRNAKNVFFIGIGGISVSSLAKICHLHGKRVFGYDSTPSEITLELESFCHIKYCSTPDSTRGMDLVVYTSAINEKNLEYAHAKRMGIPLISRANFLGYIMKEYKIRLGVSGMHGKSTATAMLGHIFKVAGREPTILCGGKMLNFDSHHAFLGQECMIFEGCEYLNAFHSLYPTEVGITNLDLDHPDFFKSTDEVVSSFQKYIDRANRVYINGDCPLSSKLKHKSIVKYGIVNKGCEYTGKIIGTDTKNHFEVFKFGIKNSEISLGLFGKHFIYDALLAYAMASENGIDKDAIKEGLSSFLGVGRRMECLGTYDGVTYFEDYAHHPTEIKASLEGLRSQGFNKILCIYQAHTYSRSYFLREQFKNAFCDAYKLIILPTYSAREENVYNVSDKDLSTLTGGIFIDDFTKIRGYVSDFNPDCVVIMGAGDIYKIKGLLI